MKVRNIKLYEYVFSKCVGDDDIILSPKDRLWFELKEPHVSFARALRLVLSVITFICSFVHIKYLVCL